MPLPNAGRLTVGAADGEWRPNPSDASRYSTAAQPGSDAIQRVALTNVGSRRGIAIRALVVGVVAFVGGCEGNVRQEPAEATVLERTGEEGTRKREFVSVAWDTLAVIGGEAADSLLQFPRLLAMRDTLLVVYDYHGTRVLAFNARGRILWTFGRAGDGPGEFRNAFDLEFDRMGRLWVLDAGTGRVTVLSSTGEMRYMIRISEASLRDIIPRGTGLLATAVATDFFWARIDSLGRIVQKGTFPHPSIQAITPDRRQTIAAIDPRGDRWSATLPFGNDLMVYRGTELQCLGKLIEGESPPATEDVTVWAAGIGMTSSAIFVLARGRTEQALQIVDEYSAIDCSYRRSMLLPRPVKAMAVSDAMFAVEFEDPAPRILILRLADI